MYLKKRLLALAAPLCFAVSVPLLALATESDFSPETDDPVSDPPLSSEFSSEPEPPSSSDLSGAFFRSQFLRTGAFLHRRNPLSARRRHQASLQRRRAFGIDELRGIYLRRGRGGEHRHHAIPTLQPGASYKPVATPKPNYTRPKETINASGSVGESSASSSNYVTFARLNVKNNSMAITLFYSGVGLHCSRCRRVNCPFDPVLPGQAVC